MQPTTPRLTWRNGGSVTVTWAVGDVRPKDHVSLTPTDGFLVIVRDSTLNAVSGSWTLTARGLHDVVEGTVSLPVADVSSMVEGALSDFMRRLTRR